MTKTLKVMSIIGIVLSSIMFLYECGWSIDNADQAVGAGAIATVYLFAFAIVGLVQYNKNK